MTRICNRCGLEVEPETILEYPWYCPECDENMYKFETKLVDEVSK